MARRACQGIVEIGSTPTVFGELRGWTYNNEAEEQDASVMGLCDRKSIFGAVRFAGTLRSYWEHDDAGQLLALVNTVDTLAIKPEGTGSTLPLITGQARFGSVRKQGDVNGLLELEVDYIYEAAPTEDNQI